MSLPSGWIVGQIGYKRGIVVALSVIGLGLLLFVPASMLSSIPSFCSRCSSSAAVSRCCRWRSIPTLARWTTGDRILTAQSMRLIQLLATTIAPKLGAAFIFIAAGATTAELAHSVRMPYVILAIYVFGGDRYRLRPAAGGDRRGRLRSNRRGSAWQLRSSSLGCDRDFYYVGAEVAIGSVMINFLGQPSMGGVHTLPRRNMSRYYWGGTMIGRLIGVLCAALDSGGASVGGCCVLCAGSGCVYHHRHTGT